MTRNYPLLHIWLLIISSLLLPITVMSQQLPVMNHNYLIPYLYNPAYVAANDVGEVTVINRQQWLGLDGSPVTSALLLQLPATSKFSFGASLYHDKYGLLTNMSAAATVAYRIKLSPGSFVQAGLSLGYARQSLDLNELDHPDDQAALVNYSGATGRIDGNAGLMYQWQGLRLGVALPRLFANDIVVNDENQLLKLGRLDYWLTMASYRFDVTPFLSLEPSANYRAASGVPNQYEVFLTAYYRDKVWAGVSHRQDYSPAFYVGAAFNRLRVGYNYELSTAQVQGFTNATHEVSLGLRFGARKGKPEMLADAGAQQELPPAVNKQSAIDAQPDEVDAEDTTKEQEAIANIPDTSLEKQESVEPQRSENIAPQPAPQEKSIAEASSAQRKPVDVPQEKSVVSATPPPSVAQQQTKTEAETPTDEERAKSPVKSTPPQGAVPSRNNDSRPAKSAAQIKVDESGQLITIDRPVVKDGEERIKTGGVRAAENELAGGFYIVVGAFRVYDNAVKFTQQLKTRGFDAQHKYSPKTKFYYVYFADAPTLETGRIARGLIRQEEEFKDAWLLVVEP